MDSDPTLLWLWCRPVATAPIQPLARELPYAVGMALKNQKKKKKSSWRRVSHSEGIPYKKVLGREGTCLSGLENGKEGPWWNLGDDSGDVGGD